jgi:hypothetical protein
MKLPSARPTLEFGPHRHPDLKLLTLVVEGDDPQS